MAILRDLEGLHWDSSFIGRGASSCFMGRLWSLEDSWDFVGLVYSSLMSGSLFTGSRILGLF